MIKKIKRHIRAFELIVAVFLLIFSTLLITLRLQFNTHEKNINKNINFRLSLETHENLLHFKSIVPEGFKYVKEKTPNEKKRLKKAKKKIDYTVGNPYLIKVNRAENFAVIYGINKKTGNYSVPYKAFYCSTAKSKKNTPLGTFSMSERYRWHLMVDGTYAQYAIRIQGEIMLHSVPYYSPNNDALETEEYNKLGSPASLGCVRFSTKDIKWIYDNCNYYTTVTIYSKKGEAPPNFIKEPEIIDINNENSGWDPTDPQKDNPWNK